MAIQVSGSPVISNTLQLQNIASLDATTTATIGAAAGGSVDWINLSNTDSVTFTASGSYDTGTRDASTVLSGMPNDYKFFLLVTRFTLNTTTSSYYAYLTPDVVNSAARLGNSSSSYYTLPYQTYGSMFGYIIFYSVNYSSPANQQNAIYVVNLFDKSGPSSLPQSSLFGNPSFSSILQITGPDGLNNSKQSAVPVVGGFVDGGGDWNTQQMQSPSSAWQSVGASMPSNDLNYLSWRIKLQGNGYSSQNGQAPNVTATIGAAYVAA